MKLLCLLGLALAILQTSIATAQDAVPPATPNSAATLRYIHAAWDTLTRSMTNCHTLVDTKVKSAPVLYLPADMPILPEVAAIGAKVPCAHRHAAPAH